MDRNRNRGRRVFLLGGSAALMAAASPRVFGEAILERIPVRVNGLVGTLFMPKNPIGAPAVVSLTGVMGGLWEEPAEALARAGIPALALAVNNFEDRPTRFSQLPVEYVVQAVDWLRQTVRPKGKRVVLRGWSRGGELALLTASLSPTVNGVMAYAPRCYVALEQNKPNNFGDPTAAAAFTWQGKPVSGVPLPEAMRADPANPSLEDLHGIAVERIAGPILLISGQADTGLSGTTPDLSCAAAMRRLELYKSPWRRSHHSYPNAGHEIAGPMPFRGPVQSGGTIEENNAAIAASWPLALSFLNTVDDL